MKAKCRIEKNHKSSAAGEFGGVAIEYIIVSTFAATISIGTVAYLGKIMHEKLRKFEESLESQELQYDWDGN